MTILWAVAGFFLILTPLIIIHEIGHFVTARYCGIKVEEFGIGYPPRALILFRQKGTIFSLNWIPFGGFVRPAGEDDPNDPQGLAAASKSSRLLVLAGGSIANFIGAYFIFMALFLLNPLDTNRIMISEINAGSPAETAQLQVGDVFVTVAEQEIGGNNQELIALIQENVGQEIAVVVEREGETVATTLTPRRPGEYDSTREGAVGIRLGHPEINSFASGQLFWQPIQQIGTVIQMTVQMPLQIMRGEAQADEARMVSVIGISQIAGQATQQTADTGDLSYVLWLAGLLSVALGFTNLLPIPALDGGRILFVLIEAVIGKQVSAEREGMVHAIGMIILLGLMVILMVQDILYPIVLPS